MKIGRHFISDTQVGNTLEAIKTLEGFDKDDIAAGLISCGVHTLVAHDAASRLVRRLKKDEEIRYENRKYFFIDNSPRPSL